MPLRFFPHPPLMNLVNLSRLGSLMPSSLLNLITTLSEFLFLFFRLVFPAAHNSLSFPHYTKYLIHFNKVNNQLTNKNRQIFINPISNSFWVQTTSKWLGSSLLWHLCSDRCLWYRSILQGFFYNISHLFYSIKVQEFEEKKEKICWTNKIWLLKIYIFLLTLVGIKQW